MHRLGRFLLPTIVALLAGARTVSAQQLTFSPQLGIYVPTRDLEALDLGGDSPRLRAGPSFGAAIGVWFGSRFGLSLTGAYVPTSFQHDDNGSLDAEDAELIIGTAQLVLYLLPKEAPVSVFLSGGMGLVSRGGVAFVGTTDPSDLTGAFGAGAALRLGGLDLLVGADLLSYTVRATGGLGASDSPQRDILVKVGLGIPVGAR